LTYRFFNGPTASLRRVGQLLFLVALPLSLVMVWGLLLVSYGNAGAMRMEVLRALQGQVQTAFDFSASNVTVRLNALRLACQAPDGEFSRERFRAVSNAQYSASTALRAIEWHVPSGLDRDRSAVLESSGSFGREGQVLALDPGLKAEDLTIYTSRSEPVASQFFMGPAGRGTFMSVGLPVEASRSKAVGFLLIVFDADTLVNQISQIARQSGFLLSVSDGTLAVPRERLANEAELRWSTQWLKRTLQFSLYPINPPSPFLLSAHFFGGIALSFACIAFAVVSYVGVRAHFNLMAEKARAESEAALRDEEHSARIQQVKRHLAARQMLEIGAVASQIAHEIRNKLTASKALPAALAGVIDAWDARSGGGGTAMTLTERDRKILTKMASMAKENLVEVDLTLNGLTSLGRANIDEPRLTSVNPFILINLAWKSIVSLVQNSQVRLQVINPPEQTKVFFVMDQGLALAMLVETLKNAIEACRLSTNLPRTIEATYSQCVGILPADFSLDYSEEAPSDMVWGVLRITDNGCGIAQEDIPRIFSPTYSTKEGDIRGMGLCRVAEIMAMHKGAITVSSHLNKGTSISFYFRLTTEKARNEPTEIGATAGLVSIAASPMGLDLDALIVDDEASVRNLLAEFLSFHGVRTVEATTGEEALALLRQGTIKPNLIFLDHRLGPGVGGMEVAATLRGRGDWTLVHCSATVTPESVAAGEIYMPKPFGPDEVARILHDYAVAKKIPIIGGPAS
jgi:signal transduction histidine kinase/ActR/RegA family two-component response regulator